MNNYPSPLHARVVAVNRANDIANKLYPKLRAFFDGLAGQKVIKTDGSFLESIKKQLPELPQGPGLQVFRDSRSSYSINFVVRVWEQHNEGGYYHEVSLYVANLTGQICKAWTGAEWENHRTDWTPEEVQGARKQVDAARQILRARESKLGPFGEYDR